MTAPRLLAAFAGLYLFLLYAPLALLPVFAFNDNQFQVFPLAGFTTKWFEAAFKDDDMMAALGASMRVGAIAAVAATILGLLAAKAIARYRFRGRTAVTGFLLIPLFMPEVILGIALLILLNTAGIELSLTSVMLSHVVLCVPFSISVLVSRLEGFDASLEEASLDLGEGPLMTFWRVTLPLIWPAVVSSLLLCFIVSFDDFLLAYFLSGEEQTLPLYFWNQLRFPARLPPILAMGTLILVASFIGVALAEWLRRRGRTA